MQELKVLRVLLQTKDQYALMDSLEKFLKNNDYRTLRSKEDKYLLGEGDIPVALVAHLDTVAKEPPKTIYYFKDIEAIGCGNQVLGADDRAGVFAILKIINDGYKPHVIFTTDEEIGCKGAVRLVTDFKQSPFKDLRYCIQLDRQGEKDCVFYDLAEDAFENYVQLFDFEKAEGTYSDISVICPSWNIAGVNLSVGYRLEHTAKEYLILKDLYSTIYKVEKMISRNHIPKFEAKDGNYKCYNCGAKMIWILEGNPFRDSVGNVHRICDKCAFENPKMKTCPTCGISYLGSKSFCELCMYERRKKRIGKYYQF